MRRFIRLVLLLGLALASQTANSQVCNLRVVTDAGPRLFRYGQHDSLDRVEVAHTQRDSLDD